MAMVSIVQYIQELKKAGFTEQQAEVQAKEIESLITEVRKEIKEDIQNDVRHLNLATTNDLKNLEIKLSDRIKNVELNLKSLEIRLIKWVVGTGVITVATTIGTLLTVVKVFAH